MPRIGLQNQQIIHSWYWHNVSESSRSENLFIFQFEPKALFGGSQAKSPSKDDGDDKVEEYEPQVDFQPVVPLPDLVEVKTGE